MILKSLNYIFSAKIYLKRIHEAHSNGYQSLCLKQEFHFKHYVVSGCFCIRCWRFQCMKQTWCWATTLTLTQQSCSRFSSGWSPRCWRREPAWCERFARRRWRHWRQSWRVGWPSWTRPTGRGWLAGPAGLWWVAWPALLGHARRCSSPWSIVWPALLSLSVVWPALLSSSVVWPALLAHCCLHQ